MPQTVYCGPVEAWSLQRYVHIGVIGAVGEV